MRIAVLLLVVALAGCARSPEEATNERLAGVECPQGKLVGAFTDEGEPVCVEPPWIGVECPPGSAVAGFDELGRPTCRSLATANATPTPTPTPPPQNGTEEDPPRLAMESEDFASGGMKSYRILGASAGLQWEETRWTVNDVVYSHDDTTACNARVLRDSTSFRACSRGVPERGDEFVDTDDVVSLFGVLPGDVLRVFHARTQTPLYAEAIE